LIPFGLQDADEIKKMLLIWNTAAHPDYLINERFASYNLMPFTGETVQGRFAILDGEPVGFVLTCAMMESPANTLGWVSAIAVCPTAQRQGIGSSLLAWAEDWLKQQGCERIRIGGNFRPFAPGLPSAMRGSLPFFAKHAYQMPAGQPYEYDIARSLKNYQSVYAKPVHAELVPMQPGQEALLLEFLKREYPGRWQFEAQKFVRDGGRSQDYLLLWVDNKVEGFCRITLEDSERPIERFYPQRLVHSWGQFGPLGLSKAVRGQGLGGYLIDAAALHMQLLGVDGCVIDWTALTNLYAKFGFNLYNQYLSLFKTINV
jgi:GNAT superfamily N-acetyltransferase